MGDMARTMKACGGYIQSSTNDLRDEVLGTCGLFEEKQVGSERFNFFTGCPKAKTCTIIIRGGAVEMEVSKYLNEVSRRIHGKQATLIRAFGKALEIIPMQLCHNGGLDATEFLTNLRHQHAEGSVWAGIDLDNECVSDNMKRCVWEPALVKTNALRAAGDAAALIISVDQTIKNKKSTTNGPPGGKRGR